MTIATFAPKRAIRRDIRPRSATPRPRHENGSMNKTEASYAMFLNNKLLAGEIAGWWHGVCKGNDGGGSMNSPEFDAFVAIKKELKIVE